MAGLTNGKAVTDVGTRHETQTAHQSGSAVGQDVSVQVGGHDHVVILGLAEELVHHRVDDLLLDVHGRETLRGQGLARRLPEETVRLRQDVGLVGDGHHGVGAGGLHGNHVADLLATQGNLSGDGGNAGRCLLGDPLDGLGNLAVGGFLGLFVLDVEVLGVLPDNDHVDGVTAVLAAGGLDRTHVGVEVHLFAESDNRRGVTGDLGAWGAIHEKPTVRAWPNSRASLLSVTHLTAPNKAPSHSFFRVSKVLSGRAVPVRLKVSNPASKSTKLKLRFKDEGSDSRIRRPAY